MNRRNPSPMFAAMVSVLERIARLEPQVLACMHGSAWKGNGAGLIRALARSLGTREFAAAA